MVKKFIFIIILSDLLNRSSGLMTNSNEFDCDTWKNEHIFLAKDVHLYNMTFAFVKIDTLEDLNVSFQCNQSEYNIDDLKIYANENILLNNDLNLDGVLHLINRTNVEINIVFQNLNGFN